MPRKVHGSKYISESGGEYSYKHSFEELKKDMLDVVAVNDLVESAFVGVTSQFEVDG